MESEAKVETVVPFWMERGLPRPLTVARDWLVDNIRKSKPPAVGVLCGVAATVLLEVEEIGTSLRRHEDSLTHGLLLTLRDLGYLLLEVKVDVGTVRHTGEHAGKLNCMVHAFFRRFDRERMLAKCDEEILFFHTETPEAPPTQEPRPAVYDA